MTIKPYPSITRIAGQAARKGYVVGVEDDKTVIETGTTTVTFHYDRSITDSEGKTIDSDKALDLLGITLD